MYASNPLTIAALQQEAWQTAEAKGFHAQFDVSVPGEREQALMRLALIHTEVSEATQEIKRYGLAHPDRIGDELADILIRVADMAETLGISLEGHVAHVLARNKGRALRYGTPDESQD